MNIADYWLMSREYLTADLDLVTFGIATKEVYSTFFYSTSTYTLCQQPDEILFGHFHDHTKCSP